MKISPISNCGTITSSRTIATRISIPTIIRAANPHIKYWDSSIHGYAVLTITPALLTCEFKAVSTVQEPTATLVPLKTFNVPVNQVKLNVVNS